MTSENEGSKQQPETPKGDSATLLWTILEEIATTQSYLEVMLRNQAIIRAKLEERSSEEVLSEMETDQKSVFQFLWPKVMESMSSKIPSESDDDDGEKKSADSDETA
ncbi:MAG: hypothetical protein JWQ98_405 [Chlorobi bacterium]|nr:hypothetical protein [Chlorobiota bacterium]